MSYEQGDTAQNCFSTDSHHYNMIVQGSSALPGPAGVILPSENLIDQILMQADTTEVVTTNGA